MVNIRQEFKETLDFINSKTNNFQPEIAIVLGSGLSVFCENLEGISIKYSEIPHFGTSSVLGHKSELLFCEIDGKKCAVMQGRFHYYEGNTIQICTYPIKILRMLGAKNLIVTNASGGINPNLQIGDIMMITDHINLMGDNPLIGPNEDILGERFPDMSNIYTLELQEIAKKCSSRLGIKLKDGVYIAVSGPSYETKAEIRAYKLMGADAVGMSTAPETIVSNYLGMKTVALSLITNMAAGIGKNKLNHKEVLEIGQKSGGKLCELVREIIKEL